ncbi:type II secretion system F family protein [Paraburkholderia bryophila]|uniref:Tight adherence protein C n=1 Tax=Paraburkholderia bryophila TaxID=420952 RepID=A0A329BNM8_9BURK|nr:type II secretion system F family protein [Paraburkholderia bryophila]RAS24253.1 tight adherence protein C [Paraburkholderia bryophila]
MQAHQLFALALALAALALLLVAGLVLARVAAQRRTERTLGHALDERALQAAALNAAAARATDGAPAASKTAVRTARPTGFKGVFEHLVQVGIRWLDTPFGRQVVAEEDRRLLEQCGFVDTRTRGLFLVSRLLGALAAPVVAGTLARGQVDGTRYVVLVVIAMMAGFMLPKILLKRRAGKRRRRVVDELPLLVDLLRLLQGVGLSLDQSLQVMVNDFRSVLPVLSNELEIAQRQFATGRTREQSLNRLASSYDNEDLRAVIRLLVQVDRHGGAVQEPLKQFGDRLRKTRRAMLRERIGRLAVKMTGVMIVTLLPALMIVTAGPGVLAVTRSFHAVHQ